MSVPEPVINETVTTLYKTQGYNRLSSLQKRVLVYARKAMIAKEQTIDNSAIIFELPAPQWLSDALIKAMDGVFHGRKWGFREQGNEDTQTWHLNRWINFFDEVAYVEETIKDGAKKAGIKDTVDTIFGSKQKDLSLTKLFQWVDPYYVSVLAKSSGGNIGYYSWPYYDRNGWYFVVELLESKIAKADIPRELTSLFGDEWKEIIRLAPDSYPINCTIPEMLRDLYGFPVTGHVDALAFDPEAIGRRRYNVAQAALRRACSRLAERHLIVIRDGQNVSLLSRVYTRSGIGLIPSGIAMADRLIAEAES